MSALPADPLPDPTAAGACFGQGMEQGRNSTDMATPELADVGTFRRDFVAAVREGEPSSNSVWLVGGGPGAGKTHLLLTLADDLRREGRLKPVVVAPPPGEIDSGGVALIQVGEALKKAFPGDVDLTKLVDPQRPWRDKLGDVKRWLDDFSKDIVLLCDEPHLWPTGTNDHKHFANHAQDVIGIALHQAHCRRVVAGALPGGMQPLRAYALAPSGATSEWLADARSRGSLAEAASGVSALGPALAGCSPLQARLLVAYAHVTSVEDMRRLSSRPQSAMQLARSLISALMDQSRFPKLLGYWQDLALVRRPFSPSLLNALDISGSDPQTLDLLNNCLLYHDGREFFMHDVLKAVMRDGFYRRENNPRATRLKLARYYKDQFSLGRTRDQYLSEAMEAFHHASELGDPSLRNDFAPFFVDQLDALGRSYSRRKHYEDAAETFRCALTWEPEDDYAHHYYAYNLDIEGREPEDAERHYSQAISLDRTNIWWWSRYLSFLITLGRVPEARKVWGEALEEFSRRGGEEDPFLYENLHLWVARLLVHRGRLDFAKEILDDVPEKTRTDSARLRAVWHYFHALDSARRGQSVFPLDIRHEDWWRGPHRNALHDATGKKLSRWLPGRVDEVTKDEILLTVAAPPKAEEKGPKYGQTSFSHEEFDRASLDERAHSLASGRFVEIAYYAGQKQPVIRVYPHRPWADEGLPGVWPDPVRYLRKRGRVR
jgi:tetratricopeptide (TPR) repeat protein